MLASENVMPVMAVEKAVPSDSQQVYPELDRPQTSLLPSPLASTLFCACAMPLIAKISSNSIHRDHFAPSRMTITLLRGLPLIR